MNAKLWGFWSAQALVLLLSSANIVGTDQNECNHSQDQNAQNCAGDALEHLRIGGALGGDVLQFNVTVRCWDENQKIDQFTLALQKVESYPDHVTPVFWLGVTLNKNYYALVGQPLGADTYPIMCYAETGKWPQSYQLIGDNSLCGTGRFDIPTDKPTTAVPAGQSARCNAVESKGYLSTAAVKDKTGKDKIIPAFKANIDKIANMTDGTAHLTTMIADSKAGYSSAANAAYALSCAVNKYIKLNGYSRAGEMIYCKDQLNAVSNPAHRWYVADDGNRLKYKICIAYNTNWVNRDREALPYCQSLVSSVCTGANETYACLATS